VQTEKHTGLIQPFSERKILMSEEKRITVYVLKPKDRSTLQLQWIDPDTGARKTISAGTSDPEKAEKARGDHEYKLNHGLYQETSKLDWERFREMFEAEYLAGLRERTREKYTTVLDVFEQIINPAKLRNVNERTLSLFLKGMRERRHPRKKSKVGLAPMTMRNYLVSLKTALAWAVDQRLLPSLPTFPTVKVPRKKPQPVAPADFEKLLAKAPDELWRAFLLCAWWAGLRLSEVRELRWERSDEWPWLDFERNRVVLPAVFAKSAEDQSVPMHSVLRQAVEGLPRTSDLVFPFRSRRGGGRLSRNGITNRVIEMARQAGVKLSMHRLRKGFGCRVATKLGRGNAPILHELMRHSSMQITMDYYVNVDDALQAAINELT
jgi:integrase